MSEYYEKYIKYKNKYINLQSQLGGAPLPDDVMTPRRQGNQREVHSPLQTAEEIAAAKALAATKARADALDYFNTRNDEDK